MKGVAVAARESVGDNDSWVHTHSRLTLHWPRARHWPPPPGAAPSQLPGSPARPAPKPPTAPHMARAASLYPQVSSLLRSHLEEEQSIVKGCLRPLTRNVLDFYRASYAATAETPKIYERDGASDVVRPARTPTVSLTLPAFLSLALASLSLLNCA